jgi:hydroxyethylthiazole kinase-like uncharacterized protein yjeF
VLAATAALRAGAGKVRIAVREAVAAVVAMAVPESYVIAIPAGKGRAAALENVLESAEKASAVLIGPGLTDLLLIDKLLPQLLVLENTRALVLDAFALPPAQKLLQGHRGDGLDVILPPHAGEMALLGADEKMIAEAPADAAAQTARELNSVVAFKGALTHIAHPDGTVFLNQRGQAGLGTAGSGDVLAGLITGLCARGATPLDATLWGVSIHALCGEALAEKVAPVGFLAREIVDEIPRQMAELA